MALKILMDKYPNTGVDKKGEPDTKFGPVLGLEFTRQQGWGIGIGFGLLDIWVGWPKKHGNLHYEGCVHDPMFSNA